MPKSLRFLTVFPIVLVAMMCTGAPLKAAELIMFEQAACPWCERWEEEIGGIYHKTAEGKRAPIRRVDIHEALPDDLRDIKSGRFTPTFVLLDKGEEIGRIRGYPGDEFFWVLLNELLEKLPDAPAASE